MHCVPRQLRPRNRARLRALPVLIALLLATLQAVTPFAHAMLHVSTAAQGVSVDRGLHPGSGWNGAPEDRAEDEKPCALCAADHLLALPEAAAATVQTATARAYTAARFVSTRSSAPLDLFCRPPPSL